MKVKRLFYELKDKIMRRILSIMLRHLGERCILLTKPDFDKIEKNSYLAIPIEPLSECVRGNGKSMRTYIAIGLFIQSASWFGYGKQRIIYVAEQPMIYIFKYRAISLYKRMGLIIEKCGPHKVQVFYNSKEFTIELMTYSQFKYYGRDAYRGSSAIIFFDHYRR